MPGTTRPPGDGGWVGDDPHWGRRQGSNHDQICSFTAGHWGDSSTGMTQSGFLFLSFFLWYWA
jgi:hypothetical protein